jgi:hypothetical protein
MNNIIIIIIFIIILIIWINLHYIYISKNKIRHLNNTSTYAHYSKIDNINYLVFPLLYYAHPQHIKLNENEALYIPKKWWHWVKTNEPTAAINYWFNYDTTIIKNSQRFGNNMGKPHIIKHAHKINWDKIDDEYVSVWKSDGSNDKITTKLSDFRHNNNNNQYMITLSNFKLGEENQHIKNIIEKQLTPPDSISKIPKDFNLWISSGKHDTGLHYDDDDGYLCVLYGSKDIILYPPSDSPYLYPYSISEIKWLNRQAYNFRYNTFQMIEKVDGLPSAQLLYETCKLYPNVLSTFNYISNLYNNSIVWGFKKYGNIYKWEIYVYTLHKNPSIISFDIYNSYPVYGDEMHLYYNINETSNNDLLKPSLPFWGYGKYIKNNILYKETKIFVVDSYDNFKLKYFDYMKLLGFNKIKYDFMNIILYKYKCYELCIHNKVKTEIFVQYLGISNRDFIEFLTSNNYPDYLISHYTNSNYNINNEITIVYDIHSKNIIRTAFYGIL